MVLLEALGENPILRLFQLLEAAHIPGLMALFCLQSAIAALQPLLHISSLTLPLLPPPSYKGQYHFLILRALN